MTLASIDSPHRTHAAPKSDALEPKNDKNPRSEPSEFGQVMSEILATPQQTGAEQAAGQAEAAAGLQGQALAETPAGLSGWGSDFLKAVHLGPRLNVITAETAAPDEQSLEAFARSQGLDDTAVQWLMGTAPGQATPALALPAEALTTNLSAATLSTGAAATAGTAALTAADTGAADALTMPALAPGMPPPQQAANASGLPGVMTSAALWAMAQPTEKAHTPPPADASAEAAAVSVQVLASPTPTAIWMLRQAQAAAPGKEAATTKSGIALSELDLSDAASPELLESLSLELTEMGAEGGAAAPSGTHPTPLSGHSGHRLDPTAAARLQAQNPDTSAAAPESGLAQRSENIQNLADKMGQAVGERILSEIEKGQWHLKLSLRPATLGHIEVEMRMRSGELDAVFTTSQAVTRELLQEGLSKLKDTLNGMGMDVASFQVGDGQTQQRGGESTPGQMSKSTNTGRTDPTPVAPPAVNVPRMKMGQDGWDVLV